MTDDDYTPTTDDIETAWMEELTGEDWDAGHGKVLYRQRNAQFNRWLNAYASKAWAEGFKAGTSFYPGPLDGNPYEN